MRLKVVPEDFLVKELPIEEPEGSGDYLILECTKRGLNTEDMVSQVCRALGVERRFVGIAGAKDRHAITTQRISVRTSLKSEVVLRKLSRIDGCDFSFKGCAEKPLCLGDLKGNAFSIIVRDNSILPELKHPVPDYFDDQRFGRNNLIVARSIFSRDFKKAASIIIENHSLPARAAASFEANDFIGCLRYLPRRILRLYIHSFQSWLYNESVKAYLHCFKGEDIKYSQGTFRFPRQQVQQADVPLTGFGMSTASDARIEKCVRGVMAREKLVERDFVIPQLQGMSLEGGTRPLLSRVHDFSFEKLDADSCRVEFWLEPGSYATIVIKSLFGKSFAQH